MPYIGTCCRFYTHMQVQKKHKAFAYRIYSHFTQQCGNKSCPVFKRRGTKLERFLPNNQHTQRKLLNFENWCNGGVSKIYFQSQFSMSKIIGIFPDFFFVEEYQLRSTFLIYLTSVLDNFIFFLSVISHNVTGTAERQISIT